MPKFEVVPLSDAQAQSVTNKRAQILVEYQGYIAQLQQGQAGSLEAAPGETLTAVRRRLTAASKLAGRPLTVKRGDGKVLFWLANTDTRRRRGRPRKTT